MFAWLQRPPRAGSALAFCGWLSDRFDPARLALALRLAAMAPVCAVPAGVAVFFWLVSGLTVAGIRSSCWHLPLLFGFASRFATFHTAVSQMVSRSERSVASRHFTFHDLPGGPASGNRYSV